MSLRNDIVSFWFWGYMGNLRTELQAPVVHTTINQQQQNHYLRTDGILSFPGGGG